PRWALSRGGSENELVPGVLRRLLEGSAQVVVLARTDEQRGALRAVDPALVVPERVVDGRSLAGLADLVVSAGGTMIREAAVLGTPVWSIFEGRRGAVDDQLEREGRGPLLPPPPPPLVPHAPPAPPPPPPPPPP